MYSIKRQSTGMPAGTTIKIIANTIQSLNNACISAKVAVKGIFF